MLIKLQEVAEIVTDPRLTEDEVNFEMREIIESYLDFRISAVKKFGMSRPRPKHHFLSHYPDCYKNYDPLINVWAMRIESKHTYFKGIIKASKNLKNVALTCPSRHELAQVCYRYYGLYPVSKFDIPANSSSLADQVKFTNDVYIRQASLELPNHALTLKILRTLYSPGMVLVVNKKSAGVVKVGIIRLIAFNDEKVFFGLSTFLARQSRYNFYVSIEDMDCFEIKSYDDLQDYYPLTRLGSTSSFRFALHHFISSSADSNLGVLRV